jgi:dihydroorotase
VDTGGPSSRGWEQANLPVMIDFGGNNPPLSIEELYIKHLRPGDIYTHTYTLLEGNIRETVVG